MQLVACKGLFHGKILEICMVQNNLGLVFISLKIMVEMLE